MLIVSVIHICQYSSLLNVGYQVGTTFCVLALDLSPFFFFFCTCL